MKNFFTRSQVILCVAGVLTIGTPLMTGAAYAQDPDSAKPADNSAQNKGDGNKGAVTADSQKNDKSDIQTTRKIRRELMKDKALSTYAHNVKIITSGGKVTLKGPVKSEDEKKAVADKAESVAGAGQVDNQLEVKSN